jgi:hypothetical protein
MSTIVTTTTETKRMRNAAAILTDRICEKRVSKRVKVYDRKCPGLYVSIIPAGVATLSFKFTDPATGKQRSTTLGVHNPESFTVEDARSKVYAAKAMDPATLVEQLRQTRGLRYDESTIRVWGIIFEMFRVFDKRSMNAFQLCKERRSQR